jgi:GNAT superfamily N-acetyltransferase
VTPIGDDGPVDIVEGLVGHRVSLRFRVGERDGRPLHRDAVGELSTDGEGLVVATRRGPVPVDRSAVVAVRAVPPAPPRRASLTAITRLEGLCADAWPALVERPLGGWRLRAAGGYTGRANSGLAVGDPGMPVPAALEVLVAFAAEHGIPARAQVPVGSPWDRAVAAQGWVLESDHAAGAEVSVMVADLTALHRSDDRQVARPRTPDAEWWRLGGGEPGPAQRRVLDPGGSPTTAFLLVRRGEEPVGRLRATVVADHLHLSVLDVLAHARRQGYATTLVGAGAEWGLGHGARWAVLQVALQNTVARTLYERLGFVEHHRYRYLVPPS